MSFTAPEQIKRQGFLLTRGSVDGKHHTEIELWAATPAGPVLLRFSRHKPVFFIATAACEQAERVLKPWIRDIEIKSLEMNTFAGDAVSGVYCAGIQLSYKAADALREAGVAVFEADIRLHERFLMERYLHGGIEISGTAQPQDGYVELVDPNIKSADFLPALSSLALDIECDMDNTLFSVGIAGCGVEEVFMIGEGEAFSEFPLHWVANERVLLEKLVQRIRELDPDVLIGWNLINFDLRILLQRSRKAGVRFALGRNGAQPTWRDMRSEPNKGFIGIAGRVAIDGIDALKTATYRFANFSLEHVAQTLLGRGKLLEQDVHQRLEEIRHNFHHDKPALARYNLEDCRLVRDIFATTRVLDFLSLRSQITGLEIDRAGGAAAALSNLYLPRLHRAGFVAPDPPPPGAGSPGGYVMDSRPGLYEYVIVLDFKSLYPAIIRTFKIDPLGLALGIRQPDDADIIPGFMGARFARNRHFLPDIIARLWAQRDLAKANGDSIRSHALKILMNSFYGILGASNCRFADPRLTASITLRGHEIIQTTVKWLAEDGHEVIYGDTDSIFLWVKDADSQQQAQATGRMLEKMINERWTRTVAQAFRLESYLELEFETCFSRFLMPAVRGGSGQGSKKRYAGLVITENPDGSVAEELVFKGLENVRTDWTELAREFQAELYNQIFHRQDPREYIRKTVHDTRAGKCDRQLVYRKQLRRPLARYVKNIPPHVRAARLADEKNRALGRPEQYQHKGWISYVMTLNGPEPVEHLSSPMDYDHYIEKQIKPVADGILPFINLDFTAITSRQIELF